MFPLFDICARIAYWWYNVYVTENIKSPKFSLTPHAFGMVGILVIEFLFGILTNLFVMFPQNQHGEKLWEFAKQQGVLVLHIIIGFLLLLGTLALLVRAIRIKNLVWIIMSSIALAAVIGAIVAGAIFVPSQMAIYSLLMATFFIIALLAFFWGIYANK